jgi:PTH1 family peptidyl-tRNA hydrolase
VRKNRLLFVGLGNPGERYRKTRHNLGFRVVDLVSREFDISLKERKDLLLGSTKIDKVEIFLAKPLTFMNRSGVAVASLHKDIEPQLLVLIHDDMDIPLGNIKIRKRGASAGHRGVQSVIDMLGREDFCRIRIGVGRPEGPAEEFLLSEFTEEEEKMAESVCERARDAVVTIARYGIDRAMEEYNRR